MYFKRTFKGGGSDSDARQKLWAELECSNCGHQEYYDISGRKQDVFDFERDRVCPKCKSLNSDDYKKNNEIKLNILKQKENKLLNDLSSIRNEIETLIKSIENNEVIVDNNYDKIYK